MSGPIEFPIDATFGQMKGREYPEFESTTKVPQGQDVTAVQGMGTPTLEQFGSKVTHHHPEEELRWNQKVLPASEFPGDYQKPKS